MYADFVSGSSVSVFHFVNITDKALPVCPLLTVDVGYGCFVPRCLLYSVSMNEVDSFVVSFGALLHIWHVEIPTSFSIGVIWGPRLTLTPESTPLKVETARTVAEAVTAAATTLTREHWIQRIAFATETNAAASVTIPSVLMCR